MHQAVSCCQVMTCTTTTTLQLPKIWWCLKNKVYLFIINFKNEKYLALHKNMRHFKRFQTNSFSKIRTRRVQVIKKAARGESSAAEIGCCFCWGQNQSWDLSEWSLLYVMYCSLRGGMAVAANEAIGRCGIFSFHVLTQQTTLSTYSLFIMNRIITFGSFNNKNGNVQRKSPTLCHFLF